MSPPGSAPGGEFGHVPDVGEASAWALEHADEIDLIGPNPPAGTVEVLLLTDPWSVWCWGFEPARRVLQHRYPTVRFRNLVGGMFPVMPDPDRMGFNVERFFQVVQRTTGMPLRVDATRGDRPESTYPACVHVHAVRLLRPGEEDRYLRALRETVYLDARNVSRPDVAADVAATVGIDPDEFLEALDSGEPEREFKDTLARLHGEALHSYPTFLVRTGSRLVRVEGFQSLPGLLNMVEGVSGRLHAAVPPPPVPDLVAPGERVATREVAEVLEVGVEEAAQDLAALEAEGTLKRTRLSTGDVWSRHD